MGLIPNYEFAKRFFRIQAGVAQDASSSKSLVVTSLPCDGANAANVGLGFADGRPMRLG